MIKGLSYSVVIPVYNEEESLAKFYRRLKEAMDKLGNNYEIIFIDDGSCDRSFSILKDLRLKDKQVKIVRFKRNFGQTAAIAAGFKYAKGNLVITLDADLQNDPRDIPKLVQKINDGYDLVSGWRKKRDDPFLTKKVPSWLANHFISYFTGVKLHDYGCTLKIYRKDIIKNLQLYGEMHRFIPALASWMGASIAEVPVRHFPRRYGHSKYGLSRTIRVILDLVTVKFLISYQSKPIYVFGSIGIFLVFAGGIAAVVTLSEKIFYGVWVHRNPMALLMVFFVILGIQFVMMGLLAEISIRTYHESQDKQTYFIDQILD